MTSPKLCDLMVCNKCLPWPWRGWHTNELL